MSEVAAVTVYGRLFHTCAVVTPKARSPMVWSRVRGTISDCVEPDRSRWSDSDWSVHRKSLARYGDARFWRQRKTSRPVGAGCVQELAASAGLEAGEWRGLASARHIQDAPQHSGRTHCHCHWSKVVDSLTGWYLIGCNNSRTVSIFTSV